LVERLRSKEGIRTLGRICYSNQNDGPFGAWIVCPPPSM
jgi:hypothetical protein